MLTKQQKEIIKSLVQDSRWETVLYLSTLIIDKWNGESVKVDDQFNTVWNTAQREAKIDAIKQFLNIMEQEGNI